MASNSDRGLHTTGGGCAFPVDRSLSGGETSHNVQDSTWLFWLECTEQSIEIEWGARLGNNTGTRYCSVVELCGVQFWAGSITRREMVAGI